MRRSREASLRADSAIAQLLREPFGAETIGASLPGIIAACRARYAATIVAAAPDPRTPTEESDLRAWLQGIPAAIQFATAGSMHPERSSER